MEKIKLISSKYLPVKHGFFCKNGGVSTGNYKSLNFAGNDSTENIAKNYSLIAKYLNISVQDIITVKQYHSNQIIILDDPKTQHITANYYKADGLITNIKNIAISILTADCLPILLYAPDIGYIAAIHAGWKGAFNNIVINAIKSLISKGAKAENIICAMLPSICIESYEVDKKFYDNFIKQNTHNKNCFLLTNNKFFFDLRKYVKTQLISSGIKIIDDLAIDTYTNNDNYFSYRRATHNNLPDTGRHLSFIMLNMNLPLHGA